MDSKERFIEIFNNEVKREGADKLLDYIEKSDFFVAPASTRFHGAYKGGLVDHSLNVYDCLVDYLKKRESKGFIWTRSNTRNYSNSCFAS